jgi:diaminopimelate decarboxylase
MDYQNGILHVGGVSVETLAGNHGTPLYIYDAGVIRRQCRRVRDAFRKLPFRPFYAMKANSNLSILRLIRAEGFGCDAVSPGEIHLARAAGFQPDEIWFTCSNVSDEDLRAIPDPRIVINVNSMSEVDRCVALGLHNPIAIRVNPDVGAGHHHDVVTAGERVKFGIDLAEIETARMVIEDAGGTVVGIHAHIGSGVQDPTPLLSAAVRLTEAAENFANLRWINFGGGFGTAYRPGETDFDVESYAAQLDAAVGTYLRGRLLTGIVEPGRYLVAESGTLVARVTAKRVSAGLEWIGCDTGFNHLARPSKYNAYHHIVNASHGTDAGLRTSLDRSKLTEKAVVAGNLCESGDVFTRSTEGEPVERSLEPVTVGDLIGFCDAGAYGFSMASHYNARLLPPEVLVENGSAHLVRERQTFDDLVRRMQ